MYESALCVQLPAQYRCIHVGVGGVQISYQSQVISQGDVACISGVEVNSART